MIDETTLEFDIRTMLARRDPGSAPASLASVVHERLGAEAGRPHWRPTWLPGIAAPALAIAAMLLIAVAVAVRPVPVGPGSTPALAPSAPPSSPTDGSGLAAEVLPPLIQMIGAVALVAGLLRVAWRTSRRLAGYAAFAGALGVIWIGSMVTSPTALTIGAGVFGVVPDTAPRGDGNDPWVLLDGDKPFEILVTVTNSSKLPVRVLGVPSPSAPSVGTSGRILGWRIVGLGSWPSMTNCCLPDDARPFEPVTLGAGQMVDLVFVGRAGACATTSTASGRFTGIESVPIVYEQYTIVYRTEIALPRPVNIPYVSPCSAEEPSPAPSR